MQEIEFDEWMSDADAALWHAERDPRLRSTIALVCELDSLPDRARFDESIAYTLAQIPRLRQRVVEDALRIAPPPDAVARTITRAIESARPRPRYLVGVDALATAATVPWLPRELTDLAMRLGGGLLGGGSKSR
ncbi:MAG: hypothetical protein FJ091_16900 [Deltaproteobacteria bacterium]|nr:hypothetical protein [Deltaproteobacteria bacterium]